MLTDQIKKIVSDNYHKTFLVDAINDTSLTYGKFIERALMVGEYLREAGVKKQDKVILLLHNSSEFVILYFACLFIGAIATPIGESLNEDDANFILSRIYPKAIIFHSNYQSYFSKINRKLIKCIELESDNGKNFISNIYNKNYNVDISDINIDENTIWSLTFTSGTTDLPKGIYHKAGSLLQSASEFNVLLHFTSEMVMYHILPMYYMAGFLNTIISPFTIGATVVINRVFDAKMALRFWNIPIKYKVNTLWLIPNIALSLVKLDRNKEGIEYCKQHIKSACIGTASLSSKLKHEFEHKYSINLYESYGLSEILFISTNSPGCPAKDSSVGVLLPNIQIKIEKDISNNTGVILIKSDTLMLGYLDYESGLPNRLDQHDYFNTGDVGYLEDGYLYITDREKDLIIKGGINISPKKIESVILNHEAVENAVVIGIPHQFYGEEVTAAVIIKTDFDKKHVLDEIKKKCSKELAEHQIPYQYILFDEFPANANGKIMKKTIKESIIKKLGVST